jgi:hypothetical protein
MKNHWLAIAAISTAGVLLLAGLCVNAPLDLYVPSALLTPLGIAFDASGLTLFLLAAVYLARITGAWRQGRTWAPLLLFGAGCVAAVTLLCTLEFNVHLYGPWLMLLLATALFTGLASVFLIFVRISGLLMRRAGRQSHESRTA